MPQLDRLFDLQITHDFFGGGPCKPLALIATSGTVQGLRQAGLRTRRRAGGFAIFGPAGQSTPGGLSFFLVPDDPLLPTVSGLPMSLGQVWSFRDAASEPERLDIKHAGDLISVDPGQGVEFRLPGGEVREFVIQGASAVPVLDDLPEGLIEIWQAGARVTSFVRADQPGIWGLLTVPDTISTMMLNLPVIAPMVTYNINSATGIDRVRGASIVLMDNPQGGALPQTAQEREFHRQSVWSITLPAPQPLREEVPASDRLALVLGKDASQGMIPLPAPGPRSLHQTREGWVAEVHVHL